MHDTNVEPTRQRWRDVAFTVRWRIAAGWVVVFILLLHFVLYPVANVLTQFYGFEPLAPLGDLNWTDVLAIVGLPVGGAYADRLKDD